jgi:hypothetical protein
MKYGKAYGGADPEMTEGDGFQVIVKYPYFEARHTDPTELRPELEARSRLESRLAAKVMLLIKDVEVGKAQPTTGLGHKTVSGEWHKQIRRLLDLEMIEMTMPDKPKNRFTEIPTD